MFVTTHYKISKIRVVDNHDQNWIVVELYNLDGHQIGEITIKGKNEDTKPECIVVEH